jgi:hypothetical protein
MKMKFKNLAPVIALMTGLGFAGSRVFAAYSNSVMNAVDGERTAEYVDVYNNDNVTHEVGDVVVLGTNSTYDIQIATTATANNSLVLGVIAGQDCAAASMCKVQTRGYHSGVTIGVANAAGDMLVTSTTGEAAGLYTIAMSSGTGANQAIIDGIFGVALEATTSSTTVKAWLFGR